MISHSREVWSYLFANHTLAGRIPTPFFLPKPLPSCSAADLEGAIVRWVAEWPETVTARVASAGLEMPPPPDWDPQRRVSSGGLRPLPGGRWVLVLLTDGSIWYLDLKQEVFTAGRLTMSSLLPPIVGDDMKWGNLPWLDLTIDYTIPTNLKACHLEEFNIAVGGTNYFGLGYIDVWRIEVASHSGGSAMVGEKYLHPSQHLSRFEESHLLYWRGWTGFSLQGNYVSYVTDLSNDDDSAFARKPCVTIADWSKPNATLEESRWFIPTGVDLVLVCALIQEYTVETNTDYTPCRTWFSLQETGS